jgi:Rad3-related DNA helicase
MPQHGVGKSHIALALSEEIGKSYLLTSTLQLQEQYLKTSNACVDIKGKGNYRCGINDMFRVDSAPCMANSNLFRQCRSNHTCPYYNQKEQAFSSKIMVTNYLYFLYSIHCGIFKLQDLQPDGSGLNKRDLIIMDEAHNLESMMISMAEVKINLTDLQDNYGIGRAHSVSANDDENLKLVNALMDEISTEIAKNETKIIDLMGGQGVTEGKAVNISALHASKIEKLKAKNYSLDKLLQPMKIYKNNIDDGLWVIQSNKSDNQVTLTPLKANFLFDLYFKKDPMADKFIFMSATVGDFDTYCDEIGLDKSKTLYLECDTPFPPDQSPIIILPSLKMGYKDIDATIPKLVSSVEMLLDQHEKESGIIHTANYRIAKEILNRIDDKYKHRLIARDMHHNRKYTNTQLLEMHKRTPNAVLLSPSMEEGVDLYDDLARFQIILKMMWPSLGDFRNKIKAECDSNWYSNKMWMDMMQASGRSTRHEKDYSTTYILDASFNYFYSQWKHKLPVWFKNRILF